jgi:disulfide oxidoreductase YuzD
VLDGEFFYPVVVIGGEVVAEGDPKLKVIQSKLEALGAVPMESR